jgi:hypothetical protein
LHSHALGRLSSSARLDVLVTLKPQAGLKAYARAVTTPGSGLYHHYLSVRQFRERFGASQHTLDAVTDSLRAGGLRPGRISANGLGISVSASAAELSRAFRTSFERVRLSSGRIAFTNTSAPELTAAAAPHIQAILGLNSLSPPLSSDLVTARPRTSADGGAVTPCNQIPSGSVVNGTGAWTADDVAEAYGFDGFYATGDEGAGQTIALVEFEPDLPSDIAEYEQCYGLSSDPPTINYMEVDGGAGTGAGSGEAALDIEQILGLAPQATIDVYQGPSGGTASAFVVLLQAMVDNSSVNIISDSWGTCEASTEGPGESSYTDLTSENVIFEQAATEGKTVFAASGDDGSSDCANANDNAGSNPAVDDPASQPYVTGTGATSLPSTQSDSAVPNPDDQAVWNEGNASAGGASGGGISSYWPMPTWQSHAAPGLDVIGPDSSGAPCRAATGEYCREVPDVSADGDPLTGYPIYCSQTCATANQGSYSGGWFPAGGTSAVAPLWAAYVALVNDSSICNRAPIGFANPLLYEAAGSSYSSDFNDVTIAGTNDFTADGYTGGLYPVAIGYDMATGLGTPIGGALGGTLCDEADTVTLGEPAAQTSTVGVAVNLQFTASDSEGHGIAGFSATGLPAGLSINPATGTITGEATRPGRFNTAVTATAALTGAQATKSFSWQVAAAVTTKAVSYELDDQTLTLTTPIEQTCAVPSAAYRISFKTAINAASHNAKLRFREVAFYLGRGIKHIRTERETVNGHRRTVKVTTYTPNATSRSTSSDRSLNLKGLRRGTETLKLVVTYTRTSVSRGKARTTTVVKTITTRFQVC